jgi:capsular polysaccharide biosynthesis protein
MLSVFLSFLMEYMDQTIKTEKDVEKHLGLPVVGVIPDFAQAAKL